MHGQKEKNMLLFTDRLCYNKSNTTRWRKIMKRSPEELEYLSKEEERKAAEQEKYVERPISHRIMAWVMIAIVILAFLGTCYWLAFGRF